MFHCQGMRYFKSRPSAVLSFTGADHLDFLQSQGTADLRGPAMTCHYNLWLDYKGKIIGDGFVLKRSESETLLVSDATPAGLLVRKFDRHIIAEDVEIADLTDDYLLYAFEPHQEDPGFCIPGGTVPEAGHFLSHEDAILFHGRRLGKGTLQVLSTGELTGLEELEPVGELECEAIRIAAGIPLLPAESDQNALNPIEAGILSPISFTKGCYLGQEVVARVERLGRVSRRLARFHGEAGGVLDPCALHQQGGQVGELTTVVNCNDNGLGMGWLKSKIPNGAPVFDEGSFRVETLPDT